MGFLPINRREMQRLGWEQPDFVYVTGDAYVDHPSFGHAIISRILESHGYKVAILPQPDWRDDNAIHEFGKPRLGFLVSSGNMDSMVNHYSVSKKRRHEQVRSFKTEDALRFTRKLYRPDNAIFFAYGDIDFKKLVKLIRAYNSHRSPNRNVLYPLSSSGRRVSVLLLASY